MYLAEFLKKHPELVIVDSEDFMGDHYVDMVGLKGYESELLDCYEFKQVTKFKWKEKSKHGVITPTLLNGATSFKGELNLHCILFTLEMINEKGEKTRGMILRYLDSEELEVIQLDVNERNSAALY